MEQGLYKFVRADGSTSFLKAQIREDGAELLEIGIKDLFEYKSSFIYISKEEAYKFAKSIIDYIELGE